MEGQYHPITLRILTDKEVVYGIVDGHHRFYIAKERNAKEISAKIIDVHKVKSSENDENYLDDLECQDIAMALRSNESSIK